MTSELYDPRSRRVFPSIDGVVEDVDIRRVDGKEFVRVLFNGDGKPNNIVPMGMMHGTDNHGREADLFSIKEDLEGEGVYSVQLFYDMAAAGRNVVGYITFGENGGVRSSLKDRFLDWREG
jgi:hypothetical protein